MTPTFLDELPPLQAHVGWGDLGLRGRLGYEGKDVVVAGRRYEHALSTHAPARVLYQLGGRGGRFRSLVALNDDVPAGTSHAEFAVVADGRRLAAERVAAGEPPRPLEAELGGAYLLELVVETSAMQLCHSVWLEPSVDAADDAGPPELLRDCLDRVEIELPQGLPPADRCLATVVSPGYDGFLDDLLGSFAANSGCPDALELVFVLGDSDATERVLGKHAAVPVRCRPLHGLDSATKSALYSIARVAVAERFLCVDADTIVLGDLRPLFAALDACPPGSVLACREENGAPVGDVRSVLSSIYRAGPGDLDRILGESGAEAPRAPVLNDGVFAGTRGALLALDAEIRAMPGAAAWLRDGLYWRNQYLFNLALARLGTAVELDGAYNVQLHGTDVDIEEAPAGPRATWRGRPVRILHDNGRGRGKRRELRGRYARVHDPLPVRGPAGDAFADFVAALRAWIGLHGVGALAYSFYGTTDGRSGRVADPASFPLLGALHYLVRANGCVRVVETGTARGVSAACLASAVAHRRGARVVTIDHADDPLREGLWSLLPEPMQAAIELRAADSIAALAAAAEAGEVYDAALLDTDHSAPHVLREFDAARRIVRPGGLVLVHDPAWPGGSVEDALRELRREGYGVVRLWCAEGAVAEDDGLGLALVENRRVRA